ncbi:MAG: magnesium transporter CorA family protein [Eubacteriaceae bacterium]
MTRSVPTVVIFLSKDDLIFICEDKATQSFLKGFIDDEKSNERALALFFSGLIKGDLDYLETLEEKITHAEDDLLSTTKKEYAREIISFRRELLMLKKYYEDLNEIFEDLIEREEDEDEENCQRLISSEVLHTYKNIHNKIDRLIDYVHHLRDYVTQVREAYQAQIDIEQNNLMKAFTVITAIFLPLTLIVGWYGMNLKMPEFSWEFGYPFVIFLSITIVFACIYYFKRKKWF